MLETTPPARLRFGVARYGHDWRPSRSCSEPSPPPRRRLRDALRRGSGAKSRWATGPNHAGRFRDGRSAEKGLIEKWALKGENFLWRAPYGGRSAPLVMGNRVYIQNPPGWARRCRSASWRSTPTPARSVWEYKFNVFQSDVPPHRVGWASPAADPETGNIYVMGGRRHRHRARAGTASCSGIARSAKSSPPSRPTAAGRRLRWSTATWSSSARRSRAGAPARRASTASSRSTSAPATSSGSRARAAVPTTPTTPRR